MTRWGVGLLLGMVAISTALFWWAQAATPCGLGGCPVGADCRDDDDCGGCPCQEGVCGATLADAG